MSRVLVVAKYMVVCPECDHTVNVGELKTNSEALERVLSIEETDSTEEKVTCPQCWKEIIIEGYVLNG